jgi:DNA-binding CsgD family transcriptional regulator
MSVRTAASRDRIEQRWRPRRTEDVRQQLLASLSAALIERESAACLVVDRHLNVVLANKSARHALCETRSIRLNGERVELLTRKGVAQWNRVLPANAPRTMCVSNSGQAAESLAFTPLNSNRCVLIHVTRGTRSERMQHAFGLTRAESDVADGIFQGMSLGKIARARSASINTVKTQVRQIFQKVGVRSQVSLTRRMCEVG